MCVDYATFWQGAGTAGPYAVCLSPVGPKMALNGAELLPKRDREQITHSASQSTAQKSLERKFIGESVVFKGLAY